MVLADNQKRGMRQMSEPTHIDQIHATAILMDGKGVILRGPSGSGKSDLALRLIDRGAVLIADDRVDIFSENDDLHCTAPANLSGLLEVRGVGIIKLECAPKAPIDLIVDLEDLASQSRLPETGTIELYAQTLRHLRLSAFAASTPAKIRLALTLGPEAMVEPS